MWKCSKCGTEIRDILEECFKCGTRKSDSPPTDGSLLDDISQKAVQPPQPIRPTPYAQDASSAATADEKELEQMPPASNTRRVLVGVLLLTGALTSQCAGGSDPTNPPPILFLVFLFGVMGAVLAFRRKAKGTVLTFSILSLALTGLKVFLGGRGPLNYSIRGIWVLDIVALLLLFYAVLAAAAEAER